MHIQKIISRCPTPFNVCVYLLLYSIFFLTFTVVGVNKVAIFQEVGCDRETGLAKAAPPPRGRQEEGVCSFSTLSKCYIFFVLFSLPALTWHIYFIPWPLFCCTHYVIILFTSVPYHLFDFGVLLHCLLLIMQPSGLMVCFIFFFPYAHIVYQVSS